MRAAIALALCAALLGACGEGAPAPAGGAPEGSRSSGGPGKAPRPLAELQAEKNQLLDGGAAAFEARLEELDGHPVVVNKWASWCGPCRAEFPFFQRQAAERGDDVAFIGVNSSDNDADAAAFLEESPVPYPSYTDPDLEVAQVFNAVAAFPTTAFYDSDGELAYVKQGGYSDEESLVQDIERYAR